MTYKSNGLNLTDITFGESAIAEYNITFNSYKVNGTPFKSRKQFANADANNSYDFSSCGNIGLKVDGNDIGLQLCPIRYFYSTVGRSTHYFDPNCTKFYVIAVGGGGGGGSGGSTSSGTGDGGNSGGGGGLLALTINRPSTMSYVYVDVGGGGNGGAALGGNASGNAGGNGAASYIRYDTLEAYGGSGGGGGGGSSGAQNTDVGDGGNRSSNFPNVSNDYSKNGTNGGLGQIGRTDNNAAGSTAPGISGYFDDSIFNLSPDGSTSLGKGGNGGNGDLTGGGNYGYAGANGNEGFVYILEYFN